MTTYVQMIANEVINAGWGIETDRQDNLYAVRAYDEKGVSCIVIADTRLRVWVEVQKLCLVAKSQYL